MNIAIVTAVFGGMDSQKPFCEQQLSEDWRYDRIWINETNTPVPLPNLPNRLKAKFFKTKFDALGRYDAVIWIDGNIEVTSPTFVHEMITRLIESQRAIIIQKHHERVTLTQEISFILQSDNPYVNVRYRDQPLYQEYQYYLSQGMPPTQQLYSCNIFAYAPIMASKFMDNWWTLCLMWSWFDQSAFSFLDYWMPGMVDTIDMGDMMNNDYFKLHQHDRWEQ